MNISYKLLLTAILLTAGSNFVFASDNGAATGIVDGTSEGNVAPTNAQSQVSRTNSETGSRTVRQRIGAILPSFRSAGLAAYNAGAGVASNRKVQVGASVVAAAAIVAVAYKYYAQDTVESLEAKIEKLQTQINAANAAGNINEAAKLVTERNAAQAKLEELKAEQGADATIDAMDAE